jgi:ribonuclease P protein component
VGPRQPARSSRRHLRTLQHAWQFRRCYDSGRKLVTNHSVIFLFAPPEPDGVRVGVVASRRVGGAVKRNRAKRLLREASRRVASKWPEAHWIVLVAKSSIVARNAEEVRIDIERALDTYGASGPEGATTGDGK